MYFSLPVYAVLIRKFPLPVIGIDKKSSIKLAKQ